MSRTKGTFSRETERENESCTIQLIQGHLCVTFHFLVFDFWLRFFPLYRVEFEDVQRLANGYVEHPPKFFYTGSLWKVHIYIDPRDKVTARHRLICPSKREVMLFGDFKLRGTLLTKAPKGWG
ncbi:hypothetical protein DY000_02034517 [Brassica cretica]|uniref:MATH domain-containing protein n=1 Tax=Brassica cretica TaxID=69181 RepID=A0ABQ7DR46_BRACR|nr:hypothetical protein DY000_02034517 [Brassica cretica]